MNNLAYLVLIFLMACSSSRPLAPSIVTQAPITKQKNTSINLGDYAFKKKHFDIVSEEDPDEKEFEKDLEVAFYNFRTEDEEQFFNLGKKAEPPDQFIFPLKQKLALTSGFGMRKHPTKKKQAFHKGVDLRTPSQTPVLSSAKGVVIMSKYSKAYGHVIIIAHNHGYSTVYAHNLKNIARQGESVKKGQIVALSGNSGDSTGPHLHFEVRKNNKPLEPLSFIRNQKKMMNQ